MYLVSSVVVLRVSVVHAVTAAMFIAVEAHELPHPLIRAAAVHTLTVTSIVHPAGAF